MDTFQIETPTAWLWAKVAQHMASSNLDTRNKGCCDIVFRAEKAERHEEEGMTKGTHSRSLTASY